MYCIYKGDDAPNLIKIDIKNAPENAEIEKLITTCGAITHVHNNPTFPFLEGYTAEETEQFNLVNNVYVGAVLKNVGFKTFNGYLTFRACPKYVNYTN